MTRQVAVKKEKRIFTRIPFKTEVHFENEFGISFMKFETSDISLSGVFLQTTLAFKHKTTVLLKLFLSDISDPLRISCEVIRLISPRRGPGRLSLKKRKSGLGLRFTGLTPKQTFMLEQFLKKHV